MTADQWTATKALGPGNFWNVHDHDGNFVCFAKEPDAKRIVDGLNQRDRLANALQALAVKVDATSNCDHKRASCADVGCVGEQVEAARAALAGRPGIHDNESGK